MKPVFVLCFILTFFVKDGSGTVSTFFDQIGNAFKITWNSVIDAIKRPAQHRASAARRRASTISPERKSMRFLSTKKPYIWTSPEDSDIYLNDLSKSANDIKVTLPLVLLPKYKTLEKWIKSEADKITTTPRGNKLSKFVAAQRKFLRERNERRSRVTQKCDTCHTEDNKKRGIQDMTLSSFKAVVSDEGLKISEEESNIFGPLVFI